MKNDTNIRGIKNYYAYKAILLLVIILNSSCSKENKKDCWQASNFGFDVTGLVVCDVTQQEAQDKYPQYWFYRQGETKYCWKATKPSDPAYADYLWDMPESLKGKMESSFGYVLSKINCSSFCNLRWIEKHKSKITGFFSPNRQWTENLVNQDSCSRLTVGRVVIIRETTDSIITRELIEKKP